MNDTASFLPAGNAEDLYAQVYGNSNGHSAAPSTTAKKEKNGGWFGSKSTNGKETKEKDKKKKNKGGLFGGMMNLLNGGPDEPEVSFSGPTNFRQEIHVGFNPETGNFDVRLPPLLFSSLNFFYDNRFILLVYCFGVFDEQPKQRENEKNKASKEKKKKAKIERKRSRKTTLLQ